MKSYIPIFIIVVGVATLCGVAYFAYNEVTKPFPKDVDPRTGAVICEPKYKSVDVNTKHLLGCILQDVLQRIETLEEEWHS